ncbi:MAG: 50S ribosomal protein L32 [Parcubacteria group bacterium]
MPVPKKHGTSGKMRRRRSHSALKKTTLTTCSHCKKPALPHRVCKQCGFYKDQEVVNVLAKELKRQEKRKKKGGK